MNNNKDNYEKVIKGLECCQLDVNKCLDCPYLDKQNEVAECGIELHRDAVALLKAQEPVSVQKKQMEMVGLQTWGWVCGNCGQTVLFSAKFCPWCGREVKW